SHGRVDRRRHGALLFEEVLAAHAHVLVGRHRAQDTTRRRRLATISERADLLAVLVVVFGGLPGEEPRGLLAHDRECAPDRPGARSRLLGAAEDVLEAHAARLLDHLLADAVPVLVGDAVERIGEGAVAERFEMVGREAGPAPAVPDEVLHLPPGNDSLDVPPAGRNGLHLGEQRPPALVLSRRQVVPVHGRTVSQPAVGSGAWRRLPDRSSTPRGWSGTSAIRTSSSPTCGGAPTEPRRRRSRR